MAKKTGTVYRAKFSQMRLDAFGIRQTVEYVAAVEIFQARQSPELWAARPMFRHGEHKWEAASADALQALITADFEHQLEPWTKWNPVPQAERRPTLTEPSPPAWRQVG